MRHCPRCAHPMSNVDSDPHRRSVDHILPSAWRIVLPSDVRNTIVMCQACNGRREKHLHCWALVACVDAVAKDRKTSADTVYREWHLGNVHAVDWWTDAVSPHGRKLNDNRVQGHGDRQKENRRIVEIVRQTHRIGAEEFVYPADTAAKRVWNLATLRRKYDGPVAA